jgi:hypothetical protein
MDSKKLINFSEVSLKLAGNRNTIRANRNNVQFAKPIEELVVFLDEWVCRNSKSNEANLTIKNK